MPVLFLGLRANILFLSTNGGNCPHRIVKERDGTSEQGLASAKAPNKRPVKRSVAALLTGSSRQRLNGFIGRTQPRVGLDEPRFVIPRQTFVPRYHGGNCPHRTVKERDGTSEQGLASAKRPMNGR